MFLAPMLLETSENPFSHPDYLFEPKVDGHRLEFVQEHGTIQLYTRHKTICTRQYPELLLPFDDDIILDGEVACYNPVTGVSIFEEVMRRFLAKRTDTIDRLRISNPITYVIFDILSYKGQDLRSLALSERKAILASLKLPSTHFGIMPYVTGEGVALFEQIQKLGMEGIVGKRKKSIYEGRRSASWQKIINWTYEDVLITGYRKHEFGLLASVPNSSGTLRPAGVIRFGVTPGQKRAFYNYSQRMICKEDSNFSYIHPPIQAKVKIRNWTKKQMLRDPVLVDMQVE